MSRIIIRLVNGACSKGPFHFKMPADFEKFTDAESFRIHGRMRIRKKDAGVIKKQVESPSSPTASQIMAKSVKFHIRKSNKVVSQIKQKEIK